MHIKEEQRERHTLAVIVDNEPGILARIAGMFTARGYVPGKLSPRLIRLGNTTGQRNEHGQQPGSQASTRQSHSPVPTMPTPPS